MDLAIERWVAHRQEPWLTQVANAVSLLGSEVALVAISTLLLIVLLVARRRRDALMSSVALGGAVMMTALLKHVVQRPRPGASFRPPGEPVDHAWSFPSGHTLHTTALIVVLVALLWPQLATVRGRCWVVLVGVGLVGMVGVSRVYLGYHWASDVLAGWVLGSVWALLVVGWFKISTSGILSAPRQVRLPGSGS